MNEEEIERKRLEVLDYLQKSSHDFHMVFANAMEKYAKTEMKLIDDNLNFGYKIIQTIGIIAGFGFTAISGVKNNYFFAIGEFLLITSVAYGIYQIKKIYTSNLESIQKSSNKSFAAFDEKSKLYVETITKFLKEGIIDTNLFQNDLEIVDQKLLEAIKPDRAHRNKDEGRFLTALVIILLTGSVILLLSFVDLNLLQKAICK